MQNNQQQAKSSPNPNIFNLSVIKPFWMQLDFWLACIAAFIFYFAFEYFSMAEVLPVKTVEFGYYFYIALFAYPILEEVVFRGLIQESLQKLIENYQLKTILILRISTANLLCSLLFAASHLISQPWTWAALIFFPSLLFGYFKDKYQSLKPAIFLHILYNTGFYILLS